MGDDVASRVGVAGGLLGAEIGAFTAIFRTANAQYFEGSGAKIASRTLVKYPLVGLGLGAGFQLVGVGLDAATGKDYDTKIGQIGKNAVAGAAVGVALAAASAAVPALRGKKPLPVGQMGMYGACIGMLTEKFNWYF